MEIFVSDIHNGRWDVVLAQVSSLQLPKEKLIALYEQVVLEMLELREIELAREVSQLKEWIYFFQSQISFSSYVQQNH